MSDIIHVQCLRPASRDLVTLAIAVEERFVGLLAAHLRATGEPLFPPPELDADMQLWRTLRVRHKQRDFRASEDEAAATKRVAQWTLDEVNKLRGQPQQTLDFTRGV